LYLSSLLLFKLILSTIRLKKSRILIISIAVIDLTFVEFVKLYNYNKSIWFVAISAAFSWSEDCYKRNNILEVYKTIDNWKEFKIIIFIL